MPSLPVCSTSHTRRRVVFYSTLNPAILPVVPSHDSIPHGHAGLLLSHARAIFKFVTLLASHRNWRPRLCFILYSVCAVPSCQYVNLSCANLLLLRRLRIPKQPLTCGTHGSSWVLLQFIFASHAAAGIITKASEVRLRVRHLHGRIVCLCMRSVLRPKCTFDPLACTFRWSARLVFSALNPHCGYHKVHWRVPPQALSKTFCAVHPRVPPGAPHWYRQWHEQTPPAGLTLASPAPTYSIDRRSNRIKNPINALQLSQRCAKVSNLGFFHRAAR